MIAILTLVPVLAAILVVAFMKRYYAHIAKVAIGASLISFIMLFFVSNGTFAITWFSIGGYTFQLVSSVEAINKLLLFLVAGIGTVVMFYSSGFIKLPTEQRRFFIEMLAFETAMMAFAMSGNFIMLFIAWEFLSLTSYLLIQFWDTKKKATRAARKAVTTVLIGDIALLASIVIFWNVFGTLTFSGIIASASSNKLAYVAGLLLIIAIFTKSAQFPFSEWLPDAMEGPTPVSAYLHSSTMVKAGVFLAILMEPLFLKLGMLHILLIFGIITFVLASLNASKETHIKRVLAYSTVQELGMMIAAVGMGAIAAALYFFFAQAFYKALLFFSAGIAMNASENEDIEKVSGIKSDRLLYYSTLFGVLALGGFVPFDGFFSSVGLDEAFASNLFAFILLELVEILTSFYIFRWFFKISKAAASENVQLRYETQSKSLRYSAALMAAFTIIASILFFYPSSAFAGVWNGIKLSAFHAILETVIVAIGFYVSYLAFIKKKLRFNISSLTYLIYNSSIMNAIYLLSSIFVYKLSEGIDIFDLYLNDFLEYIAHITSRAGAALRRIANGSINAYALAYASGIILLLLVILVVAQ